jgi:hypothetical protein
VPRQQSALDPNSQDKNYKKGRQQHYVGLRSQKKSHAIDNLDFIPKTRRTEDSFVHLDGEPL